MSLERRVITECMQLYREFPCLWDNRQVLYSNKESRDQAYYVLLEKYKQLQEDATVIELKKRIENMRTSFRREHKRVLLSKLHGQEYSPQLWYYGLMTFLTEVMEFSNLEIETDTKENGDFSMKIEYDEESSSSLRRLLETPTQRAKKKRISTVYVQDQQDSEEDVAHEDLEEIHMSHDNDLSADPIQNGTVVSEAEAFGTTVGLQLKELDQMQKIYAEKLISDIIYNARLNRLTFHSSLKVNDVEG